MTDALFQQAQSMINDGISIRQSAKAIGFSEGALRKRLKMGKGTQQLGRFSRTFSPEQEKAIVDHCISLDNRFFGLTLRSLRSLIFQFAEKNNIQHRFSIENRLAGKDFTRDFMKRNSLSLRNPRKTSIARIMGFNRVQLNNYFNNLETVMEKYGFSSDRLYNMDETGVQTVPNKLPKHVAPKGKREVGKSVAAEQGQTVTVVCSMSAVGHHIPPFFIFARKRINPQLINGGPTGCDMAVTDKGYMTSATFIIWLKHFQKFTHPTAERPVLLILDNHISHVSLEAITYAKENHIIMLSLPPHSSHRTQPLDRNFFRPFKAYYDTAADSWNVSHPGQTLNLYNVAGLVKIAFEKSATVENAVEGFRATGIYPFNRQKFSDADFLPSEVTDQAYEIEGLDCEERQFVVFNINNTDETEQNDNENELSFPALTDEPSGSSAVAVTRGTTSEATTSCFNQPMILPDEIIPLPKVQVQRKRRKGLSSVVLTSTPHKMQLETLSLEKKKLEEEKERKATERGKRKLHFSPQPQPQSKKKLIYSSSSESEEDISLHNSSSDLDISLSDDENNNDCDEKGSPTVLKKGDFAIVKVQGKTKNSFRLYVFRIESEDKCGYDGFFYKRVPKTTRFEETKEDGYVEKNDIQMKLSQPVKKSSGRFLNTISFPEELSHLTIY